jgi:membrane protein DedA with SNARE-associated domain
VPACTLWAVSYIAVGALAAGSYRQLEGQLRWAGLIFVGIIAIALLIIFLIRRAIERSESRHMDPHE